MKTTLLCFLCGLLGTLTSVARADDDDDDGDSVGYMALEYGRVSLKQHGSQSKSISSIRLNMFDTIGGLTAGLRVLMKTKISLQA